MSKYPEDEENRLKDVEICCYGLKCYKICKYVSQRAYFGHFRASTLEVVRLSFRRLILSISTSTLGQTYTGPS